MVQTLSSKEGMATERIRKEKKGVIRATLVVGVITRRCNVSALSTVASR